MPPKLVLFLLIAIISISYIYVTHTNQFGPVIRQSQFRPVIRQSEFRPVAFSVRRQNQFKESDDSMLLDSSIVICNQAPKTASTSFAGVSADLAIANNFSLLYIPVSRHYNFPYSISLIDQILLAKNIIRRSKQSDAVYSGHISFIDFAKLGLKKIPTYINVVRDPLERFISYFYYRINGDDFQIGFKHKQFDNYKTLDECVAHNGTYCQIQNMWRQIPMFCGYHRECWNLGSKWALEMAKHNLLHNYLVVGIAEDLKNFFAVLEILLPRYFRDAVRTYEKGTKSNLRHSLNVGIPSQLTIETLKNTSTYQMEHEFYNFAKEEFYYIHSIAGKRYLAMPKNLTDELDFSQV